MRFGLLLFSLTILVACATGKKFHPEDTAIRDDQARLFVYRPWAFGGAAGRPDIQIDGKEYATLTNGGYAIIELAPGVHTLEFLRLGGASLGKFNFILAGGQDHYLRYEDSSRSAQGHYVLAADFLKDPKDTIEKFSKDKFDRSDAIIWRNTRSVFDPCFYFVKPEVALEEIKKTRKVFPQ